MSKKLTTFNVMAKLTLDVSIAIDAESLLDALYRTTELKEQDFVTIDGEYLDGEMKIIGVYE
mgnify:CR=1 FL=1